MTAAARSSPLRVAAIQMVSTPSVEANLDAAQALVAEAVAEGARLVALPEYFCFMGMHERDKVAIRERDGHGPIQDFLARVAREHGVWIVGGTVPLEAADPARVRNSSLLYDDTGRRVARYDKIHLFGFERGAEKYREANTIEPGDTPVAVATPFGRLALSVCYDVRFPELYRRLAPMDVIAVPSAFTATTGRAHWDMLVRSRAVENLAYVVAPAQGGRHPNGRLTHGHTMIVDPWGEVLGELVDGPGVVIAEIDADHLARVRASLPALEHRVL